MLSWTDMSITLAVTSREPHTARELGILKKKIMYMSITLAVTSREPHTARELGTLKKQHYVHEHNTGSDK